MKPILRVWSLCAATSLTAQTLEPVRIAPDGLAAYLKTLNPTQLGLLEKLNRADRKHIWRLPVIIGLNNWPSDEMAISPMPAEWPEMKDQPKALRVDLRQQAFGAYESGKLVYWGPVNSGVRSTPTPVGDYHLNWRSTRHVSSDNPKWILPWYFNFENKQGRAFHAYDMPGQPASHSCVRLLMRDARWVHDWGQAWQLAAGGREVATPGTPVRIEGEFDFVGTPPWRAEGLAFHLH